jgi:hypothetical protein
MAESFFRQKVIKFLDFLVDIFHKWNYYLYKIFNKWNIRR